MRGDEETYDGISGEPSRLFQHMFQYTLSKDFNLCIIVPLIPQNATCMSPEIQNEVIAALADVTVKTIDSNADTSFSYAVMANKT